jgi:hypothetical protein
MEQIKEETKLRNPLCVRWDNESHRRLTDAAWRERIHASELVRRLVAEGLTRIAAAAVAS